MVSIMGIHGIISISTFIAIFVAGGMTFSAALMALFVCGWFGLFGAMLINELTPGYTMG